MSIHFDILTSMRSALATRLSSLSSLVSKSYAVKIKKRPSFDKDRDTDATDLLVVISPEDDTSEPIDFDNGAWLALPALVTAFIPGRQTLTDPVAVELMLDVRQEARLLFHRPSLAGVLAVKDCDYEGGAMYDVGDLSNLHDVSRQRFVFKVDAVRSS